MGPRVPFVSNPFGTISPNKVVETETETETYGPGIDQSQHAKSVSHIIRYAMLCYAML